MIGKHKYNYGKVVPVLYFWMSTTPWRRIGGVEV